MIHLSGFSDAILRFVSARSDSARVKYIDSIDKKYDLSNSIPGTVTNKLPITLKIDNCPFLPNGASKIPKNSLRIFISSTFRDMHSERDLLTRFVIPQLRLHASKIGISIFDVDLRWGVTESEAENSLEICLQEAKQADLFFCILGDRYGHRPDGTIVNKAKCSFPELQGFEDRSITEMEIRVAVLEKGRKMQENAFFFFRDNSSFEKLIPTDYKDDFTVESNESSRLLKNLKDEILKSGCQVVKNYPATYNGLVKTHGGAHKVDLGGLEQFAEQATSILWGQVIKLNEMNGRQSQNNDSIAFHAERLENLVSGFAGRRQFCLDIARKVNQAFYTSRSNNSGFFVISGGPGCGKSAIFANVIYEMAQQNGCICLYYFSDAKLTYRDNNEMVDHFYQCLINIFTNFGISCDSLEDLYNEERVKMPTFQELLKAVKEMNISLPILFAIDGIELMDNSFLMEDIDEIPHHCVVLVSCRNTSPIFQQCERLLTSKSNLSSQPFQFNFEVPSLPVADRSQVVKSILSRYGKKLEDSAWDNQMSTLTQKRHAGLPAFLAMACEELRLFGLYEELSLRLRKLPHTMTQLLGDIITRLEQDHGKQLVEHGCCLLAVAPNGFEEADFRKLLSLSLHLGPEGMQSLQPGLDEPLSDGKSLLKKSVFCQFLQSFRGFLTDSSSEISICNSNILEVIEHTYFGSHVSSYSSMVGIGRPTISARAKSSVLGGPSFEKKAMYCRLIATYYCSKFNNNESNPKILQRLPHFLSNAGCFAQLARLLTSFHYLAARVGEKSSIHKLLNDFKVSIQVPLRLNQSLNHDFVENSSVRKMESFLRRNAGHLSAGFPHLLWQSALNDDDMAIKKSAIKVFDSALSNFGSFVMLIENKVEVERDTNLELKPTNFVKEIQRKLLCCDVFGDFIAFGCDDGTVSVWYRTGTQAKQFHGHAGPIVKVKFSQQPGSTLKLFSASYDCTVSCWDVYDGSRKSVLNNHQRPITDCSVVAKLMATSSTDCSLCIYDVVSRKLLVKIYEDTPINAVVLHPEGNGKLACALWDNSIRIWQSTPKETTVPKRIAILRGHNTPVQSLVFSPCGKYIASGSVDGEIRLFLSDHGLQIGVLGFANNFPVQSLKYMGDQLVSAGSDWRIKIWTKGLGRQTAVFPLCNVMKGDGICCLAVSNDLVALATKSGQILLMKKVEFSKTPQFQPTLFKVDTSYSPVLSMVLTEFGNLVYSCQNGTVRNVDIRNFEQAKNCDKFSLVGTSHSVNALATNFLYTATGSSDAIVRVYESQPTLSKKTKEVSPLFTLSGHRAAITALYMNDEYLLSGDMDGSYFVWQLKTRKVVSSKIGAHGDRISGISLTKDFVITAGSDSISCWHLQSAKFERTVGCHSSLITTLVCHDGCVISGDCNGIIKTHSWRGVEVSSIKTGASSVAGLAFHVELNEETSEKKIENETHDWGDQMEIEEREAEAKKKAVKKSGEQQRNIIVYCANSDGWVRSIRPLEAEIENELKGHVAPITSLAIDRSDKTGVYDAFSCSLDGVLNHWQLPSSDDPGDQVASGTSSVITNFDAPISTFFTNCPNRYFVTVSNSLITIWKSDGNNLVMKTQHKPATKIVSAVPALGDLSRIYVVNIENEIIQVSIPSRDNAPLVEVKVSSKTVVNISRKSLATDQINFLFNQGRQGGKNEKVFACPGILKDFGISSGLVSARSNQFSRWSSIVRNLF